MGMHMDLQDCAFGHEQAMKEYDALQAELAALRAERDAMLAEIRAFCEGEKWTVDPWKKQPHIAPLFARVALKEE